LPTLRAKYLDSSSGGAEGGSRGNSAAPALAGSFTRRLIFLRKASRLVKIAFKTEKYYNIFLCLPLKGN